MERSAAQFRTIATAMLIMGLLVEVIGVAFLIMGKPVSSVVGVLVPGILLIMLGVIFLARARGS